MAYPPTYPAAQIIFPASVFPVEVYACITVEDAAPLARTLPAPVVALPPATYFATQGSNGSSCTAGMLAATIARPWYAFLFRTLDINRLLRTSPGIAQLAAASPAARAALLGAQSPSLLLDAAAIATLSRSDWTGNTGPTLFALLLLVATVSVMATCYSCPERSKSAPCGCCDALALVRRPVVPRRHSTGSSTAFGQTRSATGSGGVSVLRSGTSAPDGGGGGGGVDATRRGRRRNAGRAAPDPSLRYDVVARDEEPAHDTVAAAGDAGGAAVEVEQAAAALEIREHAAALERAPAPPTVLLYSGRPPPPGLSHDALPHGHAAPASVSIVGGFVGAVRAPPPRLPTPPAGARPRHAGEGEDDLQRRLHAMLSPPATAAHTHWVASQLAARHPDAGGSAIAADSAAGTDRGDLADTTTPL